MTGGGWRTSTWCDGGACIEAATFRKSTRSMGAGECVEVGTGPAVVAVRDTKNNGTGPVLKFGASAWAAFTRHLKAVNASPWLKPGASRAVPDDRT